jgi:hypothetical protein
VDGRGEKRANRAKKSAKQQRSAGNINLIGNKNVLNQM